MARNEGKEIYVAPPSQIDSILHLSDLTLSLVDTIESIGPYGIGFSKPLFSLKFEKLPDSEPLGESGEHIRFVAPR